jgi:ABC-type phosphate transport system substrate-binding protein
MSHRGTQKRPQISTFLGAGAVLLALALAWLGWSAGPAAAANEPFVVVVNVNNSLTQMRAMEVSNLFLKKTTAWKDGKRVLPVDLLSPASVRESFCQKVHSRGPAAVKSYWQQMIFSGREVPPVEKGSASEVLAFVRSNPGAIGYVPAGTALGGGVKAIEVTP